MNKKYHIALIGGRGFVGQEVVKLIVNHPYFQLSQIFSTTKPKSPTPTSPTKSTSSQSKLHHSTTTAVSTISPSTTTTPSTNHSRSPHQSFFSSFLKFRRPF